MSKTVKKHTPGPWTVQENADAYTHIVRDETNAYICGCGQGSDGEDRANARLIAAAPDMLAALQLVMDDCELPQDTHEIVLAAIAKAKGESPQQIPNEVKQ